jgi:hypothetical protein
LTLPFFAVTFLAPTTCRPFRPVSWTSSSAGRAADALDVHSRSRAPRRLQRPGVAGLTFLHAALSSQTFCASLEPQVGLLLGACAIALYIAAATFAVLAASRLPVSVDACDVARGRGSSQASPRPVFVCAAAVSSAAPRRRSVAFERVVARSTPFLPTGRPNVDLDRGNVLDRRRRGCRRRCA